MESISVRHYLPYKILSVENQNLPVPDGLRSLHETNSGDSKNLHLLFSVALENNLLFHIPYSFFRTLNIVRVIFRPLKIFAKNFAPLKFFAKNFAPLKKHSIRVSGLKKRPAPKAAAQFLTVFHIRGKGGI